MEFGEITKGGTEPVHIERPGYDLTSLSCQNDLDAMCRMAAYICKVPAALIWFSGQGPESLNSVFGFDRDDVSDYSLFEMTNRGSEILEVDLRQSGLRNPSSKSSFVRFSGIPLITSDGFHLGALAILDVEPRTLLEEQRGALAILAKGILSFLDLSRKNQELRQLLEKAEQFKQMFNNSNEIHCITDSEGNIQFINDSVLSLLGYAPDEAIGKNIWSFSLPGERERIMPDIYNKITQGNSRFMIETQVMTKSGKIRWFSWSDVIKEGYWMANGRDITESKKTELQLQTLSVAVEKSSIGVLIRNADNEVVWMNRAMEDFFGYSLSELKGQKFGHLLVGEETDLRQLDIAEKAFNERKPYQIEVQLYRKDKTPVWMYLSNSPLFHENHPDRWVCAAVDITERKKAELGLVKTRDEAIRLSTAKENFLSVMSHEMRTPLNAVIGITDALIQDSPRESQAENLEILKFSANNLLTLINDVLDFTKIETGNMDLERIPFDVKKLVQNTTQAFKFKSPDKQIEVGCDIDPGIPQLLQGDPTRIYQVLTNLLGNAVKFTEKGHVRLVVSLVQEDQDGAEIKFEVRDTGIGIPTDKLNLIFEAYAQAGSDTSRKYGGTGLGLAITKKLVELHHSRIFVDSEVGKGSNFYFTIRFEKAAADAAVPAKLPSEEVTSLPSRVLLVDDNAMNRLIGKKVLTRWDIDVDFAENGAEALEKIRENDYDLVFMDIHMPVMDGMEAVKRLRGMAEGKYQRLPVIALTASAPGDDELQFKHAGMNDFILKPFEAHTMLKKITPFLEK